MRDESACGTIEPTTGILRESSVVYFTRLYGRSFVLDNLMTYVKISSFCYIRQKHVIYQILTLQFRTIFIYFFSFYRISIHSSVQFLIFSSSFSSLVSSTYLQLLPSLTLFSSLLSRHPFLPSFFVFYKVELIFRKIFSPNPPI